MNGNMTAAMGIMIATVTAVYSHVSQPGFCTISLRLLPEIAKYIQKHV
jgi:hypothetical protein